MPERPKLSTILKVPNLPSNCKAPKMIKNLRFMRGPELIHNSLIHKQYGIIVSQLIISFNFLFLCSA